MINDRFYGSKHVLNVTFLCDKHKFQCDTWTVFFSLLLCELYVNSFWFWSHSQRNKVLSWNCYRFSFLCINTILKIRSILHLGQLTVCRTGFAVILFFFSHQIKLLLEFESTIKCAWALMNLTLLVNCVEVSL